MKQAGAKSGSLVNYQWLLNRVLDSVPKVCRRFEAWHGLGEFYSSLDLIEFTTTLAASNQMFSDPPRSLRLKLALTIGG
jgi:hypothetical protein